MGRNPAVFLRGRIRHADHKTNVLHDWHRVLMNTENQSAPGASWRSWIDRFADLIESSPWQSLLPRNLFV